MTILRDRPSAVTGTLPSFSVSLSRLIYFTFWISVPLSVNFFVFIDFRLTATCLLFHKLWLIYPGSGGILFVLFSGIVIDINFPP